MKRVLLLAAVLFALQLAAAAQGTHSVVLSWTQSTGGTGGVVTGNKVYRGTVHGGPYTVLFDSSTAPITSYTDSGLGPVLTFYYVITAVCAQCNPHESQQSSEVAATTLADGPPAPTGVTATAH